MTPPAALIGVLISQVFLRCFGFEQVVCPGLINTRTIGIKTATTPSMMVRVRGLEEALNAVRLNDGSMLDGKRLGKSPMTPKKVAPTMVIADAIHAGHSAGF